MWVVFGLAFVGASALLNLWVIWTGGSVFFQLALLCVNAFSISLIVRSHRRMRALHRDYVARVEGLDRRLDHAIERDDHHDIFFTMQLMRIWDHEPKRPAPSAPDDQDGGGLSF